MAATMATGRFGVSISVAPYGTMVAPGTASTSTLPPERQSFTKAFQKTSQYGASAALINSIIVQERTLVGAATESLNLFDGSLTDIFKISAPLSKVLFISVQQIDNPTGTTNASSITVGNAAATIFQSWFSASTGTYTILGTAGIPYMAGDDTGKTVDTNNKLFKILNDDATNSATYRITIVGRVV